MSTPKRNYKLALITGPSTGIGMAARKLFKANGFRVIGLSRSPDEERDDELELNLESFEQLEKVASLIEDAIRQAESVVLVNNAGYGQFGAVRDLHEELWKKQFSVHVFGPIKLAGECLALCEKHGVPMRVIAVSSVLGIVPQQMKGAYCAGKSAMNAAHDAFWFDERDGGCLDAVSIVLPGPVATNFRSNALVAVDSIRAPKAGSRRDRYQNLRNALNPDAKKKPFTASAEAVAGKVLAAAEARWPRPRYFVTPQTYIASLITRFMPHEIQRILLR